MARWVLPRPTPPRKTTLAFCSRKQRRKRFWIWARLTLPGQDQSIYLQVTRGDHPVRNHVIPAGIEPNVVAFTAPLPARDPGNAIQAVARRTEAE